MKRVLLPLVLVALLGVFPDVVHAAELADSPLPIALSSYGDAPDGGLWETLRARVAVAPFNLVATLIFFGAICHTFMASKFLHWSHQAEEAHAKKLAGRVLGLLMR